MAVITVEGRAVRHRTAERGTVSVRIRCESEHDGPPAEWAQRSYDAIVLRAKEAASTGAATWWGAEALVTWSGYEWHKPKPHLDGVKVRKFYASAGVRVKFQDFSALIAFANEIEDFNGASVSRIEWTLTEKHRDALVDETRFAAAQDARHRAATYAKALGHSDVALVHLYEDGLRPMASGHHGNHSGVGVRNGVAASGGTGDTELRAEEVEITAVVTADFETM